jgi:hypothetical protein
MENIASTVETSLVADILAEIRLQSPDAHTLISAVVPGISTQLDFRGTTLSERNLVRIINLIVPNITHLNVSGTGAGDDFVTALAASSSAKSLKKLKCHECFMTDASAAFWVSFQALTALDLSGCRHFSLKTLKSIGNLQNLQKIRLSYWEGSAEALYSVLLDPALFRSLIRDMNAPYGSNFEMFLTKLRSSGRKDQLEGLNVSSSRRGGSWADQIRPIATLCPNAVLSFSSVATPEDILQNQDIVSRLRNLHLSPDSSSKVTELLSVLASATHLTSLGWSGPLSVPAGSPFPMSLRKISFAVDPPFRWETDLQIDSVVEVKLESTARNGIPGKVMAATVEAISRAFPNVEELTWNSNVMWEEDTVASLRKLMRLKTFIGWGRVTEGIYGSFVAFHHPSLLEFTAINAGTVGIIPGNLPSVNTLRLDSTGTLVDHSLAALNRANLPSLHSLLLSMAPEVSLDRWAPLMPFSSVLTSITLSDTSEEHIAQLKHFKSVIHLCLERAPLSDETAEELFPSLLSLKTLRLYFCTGFATLDWIPRSIHSLDMSFGSESVLKMALHIDESFTELTSIEFESAEPLFLVSLVGNRSLRRLNVAHCPALNLQIFDCPLLINLIFSWVEFTKFSVEHIAPHGVIVAFSGCTFVDGIATEESASIPGLFAHSVASSPDGDDEVDIPHDHPAITILDPAGVVAARTRTNTYRD